MTFGFGILATLAVVAAVAAMSLRNLIHCVLALVAAFGALAGLFLLLGAEFIGFAQILVYVGAVSILMVFAVLLTRSQGVVVRQSKGGGAFWGVGVGLLVAGTLVAVLCLGGRFSGAKPSAHQATVKQLGMQLMTDYVLPLQVIGLLLTAALLGAVILAMTDRPAGKGPP
jgi:NADH-quinone oxidoreductase subunit J